MGGSFSNISQIWDMKSRQTVNCDKKVWVGASPPADLQLTRSPSWFPAFKNGHTDMLFTAINWWCIMCLGVGRFSLCLKCRPVLVLDSWNISSAIFHFLALSLIWWTKVIRLFLYLYVSWHIRKWQPSICVKLLYQRLLLQQSFVLSDQLVKVALEAPNRGFKDQPMHCNVKQILKK